MRGAIEGATGAAGLSGGEAATLTGRVDSVEAAVARGDKAGAIAASGGLTTDVVGLVLSGRVSADAGDRLFQGALALGAAVATA